MPPPSTLNFTQTLLHAFERRGGIEAGRWIALSQAPRH